MNIGPIEFLIIVVILLLVVVLVLRSLSRK